MTFPHSIFKAYDIRGIVEDTLTEEITFKIGQAVGSEIIANGGDSIVIGRDGRLSGPRLTQVLSDGLRAAGINVTDIGLAPSPVVYFSSYSKNISSCIAITGSHNPPNYNGFKMVVDGVTLSAERIQAIKQRIIDEDFTQGADIEPHSVCKPVGCVECRQTGFMGRIGLYEMLEMSTDIKQLVTPECDLQALRRQSNKDGLLTLRHSGAKKVADGLTTIDEVLRVTPFSF